jgi:hypothetical protein
MESYRSFDEIRREPASDPAVDAALHQVRQAVADALALGRHREEQEGRDGSILQSTGAEVASCIQHSDNLYLSTLREYVLELGGDLQLQAIFSDEAVLLIAPEDRASDEDADHSEERVDASSTRSWSLPISPDLWRHFESDNHAPGESYGEEQLQQSVEQLRGTLTAA